MPLKDLVKRAAWKKQYYEDRGRQLNAKYYEENKEYVAEMGKIWREKNKEYKHMRDKLYKEEHKEQISNYRKVKITCGCGSTYCHTGKSRHDATQKHVIHIIEKMHTDNILTIERTKGTLNNWGNMLNQV